MALGFVGALAVRGFAAEADRPALSAEWAEAASAVSSETAPEPDATAASSAVTSAKEAEPFAPPEVLATPVVAATAALESPAPPRAASGAGAEPPEVTSSAGAAGAAEESTVEIPQALVEPLPEDPALESSGDSNPELARYLSAQNPPLPQVKGLRDFIAQGIITTSFGIEVREARRRLRSGDPTEGLLIVRVKRGSAAETAGLRAYEHTTHDVVQTAAVAAAMFFPPAILALPALDYSELGESYDMIIGIDGARVTNFLDFEDRMRKVRPGDLVYLSILRNGDRLQLSVRVPDDATALSY